METLRYEARPGMQTTMKPAVRVVKFGDGYEQRSPDGLNPLLRSYSPVFRVKDDMEAKVLDAFFTRHGSWKAFLWRSPVTNRTVRVVCREWSTTTDNPWMDFHCQFDEVMS
ncbi:phage tail protein [Salmonella enterica subsp. enterica serovar Newport]|nr:phage tail protein [Salmonella enterica subsp. enterica serovar Newport]